MDQRESVAVWVSESKYPALPGKSSRSFAFLRVDSRLLPGVFTRYAWIWEGLRPASGIGCSTHCVNAAPFLQSLNLIVRPWPTHSETIDSNCTVTPKRMYVALPPNQQSMNTKLKAFFALAVIAIVIPQAEAQNTNRTPGNVVGWGARVIPNVAPGTRFTKIAAGFWYSLALKSDGTVVAWGENNFGQSTVPGGLNGVVAIAAGGNYCLALKSDGTVVAWGANFQGQTTVPGGLTGVAAIAAGGAHSLALKSDGTVVAWGFNDSGQSAVPGGLNGVVAIAAGGSHNLALKSDGGVVAWGDNSLRQTNVPVGLNGVVAIAAGGSHSLALKSDGTIVAWGDNEYDQSTVPDGLNGVVAIAAITLYNL